MQILGFDIAPADVLAAVLALVPIAFGVLGVLLAVRACRSTRYR